MHLARFLRSSRPPSWQPEDRQRECDPSGRGRHQDMLAGPQLDARCIDANEQKNERAAGQQQSSSTPDGDADPIGAACRIKRWTGVSERDQSDGRAQRRDHRYVGPGNDGAPVAHGKPQVARPYCIGHAQRRGLLGVKIRRRRGFALCPLNPQSRRAGGLHAVLSSRPSPSVLSRRTRSPD
jgi:hypothetical protein